MTTRTALTHPKSICRLLLGIAALATALSCGSSSSDDDVGNGSNTSWLSRCTDAEDCDGGLCVNGACAALCKSDDDCEALGVDVNCMATRSVVPQLGDACDGASDNRLCAPRCSDVECDALGAGYECVADRCVAVRCEDLPFGWEPCADKSCGEPCTICAPDDPDCRESEEPKRCNADGRCDDGPVACASDAGAGEGGVTDDDDGDLGDDDPSGDGDPGDDDPSDDDPSDDGDPTDAGSEPTVYDPCDGKQCGDGCRQCPPDDPQCVETTISKECDQEGKCTPGAAQCEMLTCEGQPLDQCEAAGCSVLAAAPAPAGNFDDELPLACAEPTPCGGAETCALDAAGDCWRFRSTCIPQDYTATQCDQPLCCAQDECPPFQSARWLNYAIVDGNPDCDYNCNETLERDPQDERAVTYTGCDADGRCPRVSTAWLTNEALSTLGAVEDYLAEQELQADYGCTRCSSVELGFGDASSTHRYEFGAPPDELRELDLILFDVLDTVRSCSNGFFATIVEPCEFPPD